MNRPLRPNEDATPSGLQDSAEVQLSGKMARNELSAKDQVCFLHHVPRNAVLDGGEADQLVQALGSQFRYADGGCVRVESDSR